jgi:putative thiamine transport system permease protein
MVPRQRYAWTAATAIFVFWAAPLSLSILAALLPIADTAAWAEVLRHPQLWQALFLSIFIGTAALLISLALAFLLVAAFYGSRHWPRLASFAGASMALPHLAFAVGFAFLVMPTGLLARLIAAFAGWTAPPQWIAVQDPFGFALIAALVLKETPFLVWTLWSFLSRGDAERMFEGQWRVARGLGHRPSSVWMRLFVPQIAPRLVWPAVIVWVYGASVVDMALVLGPTQPPALAVVAWHDLNAAEVSLNARGAVASVALTLALALCAGLAFLLAQASNSRFRHWTVAGPSSLSPVGRGQPSPRAMAGEGPHASPSSRAGPHLVALRATYPLPKGERGKWLLPATMIAIYVLVAAALIVISFAAHWPFPALLPNSTDATAWIAVASAPWPSVNSIALALASALIALVLAILWFENMSENRDTLLIATAVAALALPQIMIASGQSALFLRLGWSGGYGGVLLAHLAFVFSYVAILLKGPYRAFDPRWRSLAHGLNVPDWRFWWKIKLPLLSPALAAAAAVGFAVSMAQYLPSQLLGEGRIATLTTEAVTLASGGNRPLTAAFALTLAIPTALAFLIAALLGRPRWGLAWS